MTNIISTEEALALLALPEPKTKQPTKPSKPAGPPPVQIGPLRWSEVTKPCASRGCSTQTYIRVSGIPKCTNHALYALNHLLIKGVDTRDCECKAGKHSTFNIHTDDCPLYAQIKELQDGDKIATSQ